MIPLVNYTLLSINLGGEVTLSGVRMTSIMRKKLWKILKNVNIVYILITVRFIHLNHISKNVYLCRCGDYQSPLSSTNIVYHII